MAVTCTKWNGLSILFLFPEPKLLDNYACFNMDVFCEETTKLIVYTICASCFRQRKVQSMYKPTPTPMHTTKTTSSNCKIPLGACFINTSHSSTGLPTEDYGELLECHLCFPDQWGASTVAKHGEQRDQLRLDTCIPNTRGWCPIRKQMRPSCLVQEQRRGP